MKTITLYLVSALLALRLSAGEPDTAALEQGYRASAEQLGKCIAESFADPKTCEQILSPMKKAYTAAKMTPEQAGLKLQSISLDPPLLKQDPNDLYKRFHSAVVFRFRAIDLNGELLNAQPYEVILDAYADPKMKWSFPSCDDALAAATAQCTETGMAILKTVGEIKIMEAEAKRANGQR